MAIKTYKKGSATKLSANFNTNEFDCQGKGCCSQTQIDDKLVEYIQKIREYFGKPILISSGYRCQKHNAEVGGAYGSRHTKGQAADIIIQGVAPSKVAAYAESIGVLGIGLYETTKDGHFVHIDTRDYKSFWFGHAQAARTTFGGANFVKESVTQQTAADSSYTLKQFISEVQMACGADVDSIAGPQTLSKTVTVSAAENCTHAVVKAIQKRLLALGYTQVGTVDGIAGKKFKEAVSAFQKANGWKADGEITAGEKTWKKLLGMK